MKGDRCPPHNFKGGFTAMADEALGVIWCKWCGDVRPLDVARVDPPPEELLIEQIRRDYGEPA